MGCRVLQPPGWKGSAQGAQGAPSPAVGSWRGVPGGPEALPPPAGKGRGGLEKWVTQSKIHQEGRGSSVLGPFLSPAGRGQRPCSPRGARAGAGGGGRRGPWAPCTGGRAAWQGERHGWGCPRSMAPAVPPALGLGRAAGTAAAQPPVFWGCPGISRGPSQAALRARGGGEGADWGSRGGEGAPGGRGVRGSRASGPAAPGLRPVPVPRAPGATCRRSAPPPRGAPLININSTFT